VFRIIDRRLPSRLSGKKNGQSIRMARRQPAFLQIASNWRLGGHLIAKLVGGPVVAGSRGLYLYTDGLNTPNAMTLELAILGSHPLAVLIGLLYDRKTNRPREADWAIPFVDAHKLPDQITSHPDWPFPNPPRKEVLALDLDEICEASMPWWGGLHVTVRDLRFYISTYTFGRRRIRSFLSDHGMVL
jgi:hypothetical protein